MSMQKEKVILYPKSTLFVHNYSEHEKAFGM